MAVRGLSSIGRAPALQAGGQGFDSPRLHILPGRRPVVRLEAEWESVLNQFSTRSRRTLNRPTTSCVECVGVRPRARSWRGGAARRVGGAGWRAVLRRRRNRTGVTVQFDQGAQGGFNWSSQLLVIVEVLNGSSSTSSGSRGATEVEIARAISRDPGTMSRELRRNADVISLKGARYRLQQHQPTPTAGH